MCCSCVRCSKVGMEYKVGIPSSGSLLEDLTAIKNGRHFTPHGGEEGKIETRCQQRSGDGSGIR